MVTTLEVYWLPDLHYLPLPNFRLHHHGVTLFAISLHQNFTVSEKAAHLICSMSLHQSLEMIVVSHCSFIL